jgi:hypothetical protein
VAAVPELVSTILGRICWSEAGGFPTFFFLSGRAFSKTKVGSCPSSSCIAFASPQKARRVRAGSNFGMRLYSQGWPHPNPCTDECTERDSGLCVEHGAGWPCGLRQSSRSTGKGYFSNPSFASARMGACLDWLHRMFSFPVPIFTTRRAQPRPRWLGTSMRGHSQGSLAAPGQPRKGREEGEGGRVGMCLVLN